jgi:hypothetical protein
MGTIRCGLSFILIAVSSLGQVATTVGPSPAPIGCPIAISVANDTNAAIFLPNPCPFQVRNAAGAVIYSPFCIQIIVNVNPGAVFTAYWNQVDNNGSQVPAGTYFVDVTMPGGMSTTSITIDATEDAGLAPLGPNRIGTTRNLYFCAPQDGGAPYGAAASGFPVSGGIPTCGGVVPLEFDALLQLSLGPNPFFLNFIGGLSNTGSTTAPAIAVPFIPGIVGASFVVAFITIDTIAPCNVRSISAPLIVLIV